MCAGIICSGVSSSDTGTKRPRAATAAAAAARVLPQLCYTSPDLCLQILIIRFLGSGSGSGKHQVLASLGQHS